MHAERRGITCLLFASYPQTECRDYSEVRTTINNRKELIDGSFRDDETSTKQSGSIATRRISPLRADATAFVNYCTRNFPRKATFGILFMAPWSSCMSVTSTWP